MSVPEPGERLAVTVTLHRPDERPFTASVRGTAVPATTPRRARARRCASPLETWRVRALITMHGIRLWRKGLPVQPRPDRIRPTSAPGGHRDRLTVADRLAALVRDAAGIDLPVRLRAWDGSEAGPADGPVLVIRSRRALRRLLWAPGELGLARAYVTGDLDVEGDLADGLPAGLALARSRPHDRRAARRARQGRRPRWPRPGSARRPRRRSRPVTEARLTGRLHTRLRDRAAIAHHYDLSNDFYELLLDETMAYSSALLHRTRTSRWSTRSAPSST